MGGGRAFTLQHGTSRTSSTTGCNEGKFQQQGGAHIPSQLHKR